MTIPAKIADQVRRITRRKELARALITKGDFPVRQGRWVIGPQFSRHASVKALPAPLDSVKQWGGWRKGSALKLLRGLLVDILPPRRAHRERPSDFAYACDVVLINRLKKAVGFDLSASKVVRQASPEECIAHARAHFQVSQIYPCVPFHIDKERGFIIEPMIAGHPFHAASDSERDRAVELFLQRLCAAPAEQPGRDETNRWRQTCHEMIRRWIGEVSRQTAVLEIVDAVIDAAKWSWAHGDLFAENIIVTSDGPIVIDYDKAGIAPSFTEIMTLAIFEARNLRPAPLECLFSGRYDAELAALGAKVGHPDAADQARGLFFAWLGWKTSLEDFGELNVMRYIDAAEGAIDDDARR